MQICIIRGVAQLVEHVAFNRRVSGSIPDAPTILMLQQKQRRIIFAEGIELLAIHVCRFDTRDWFGDSNVMFG